MLSNSNEFAKNISDLPRVLGTRVLIVIEGGDLIWGGGRATVGVSALYALTPTAYNFFFHLREIPYWKFFRRTSFVDEM